MGAILAIVDRRKQNAVPTALRMLRILAGNTSFGIYGLASPTRHKIANGLEFLEKEKMTSPVVVGCICDIRADCYGCQSLASNKFNMVLDGTLYPSRQERSEESGLFDPDTHRDALQAAAELFGRADDDFVFAIPENEKVIVGRGGLGVRPLYVGSNVDSICVASEKKALWAIGIRETEFFPPGNIAVIDYEHAQFIPVKILSPSTTLRNMTLSQASTRLQILLRESVAERTMDVEKVSVAFSGGVDSSLLALLARDTGKGVQLICTSLEGKPEVEHARKVAEKLNLAILFSIRTLQGVEEVLPKILYAIETPDPMQASLAIPIYWSAEKTREVGCKVMLAGQGADEMFGGYRRYADAYVKYGEAEVRKAITRDTLEMHKLNFERDFKVCSALGVELRSPFASFDIAEFALALPVRLLLDQSTDTLRKLVLRRVAMEAGLPRFVVEKPKKALQYTTGVTAALRKLAKKKGSTLKEYLLAEFRRVFGDREIGI